MLFDYEFVYVVAGGETGEFAFNVYVLVITGADCG